MDHLDTNAPSSDSLVPVTQESQQEKPVKDTSRTIIWWMLLIAAVLVVPAIAVLLATVVHVSGVEEIIVFVLACWLCIFMGLRFLRNPNVMPMFFERTTLSDYGRQHCIKTVAQIEDAGKWKKRYEKCAPVFMNLSHQPAWDYLDEALQSMQSIKHSLEKNGTVSLPDVKALHAWVESPKPQAVDAYIKALQAIYSYARLCYSEQGKHLDELFPELGNSSLDGLAQAPRQIKSSAQELLNTIRNEQPVLAATLASRVAISDNLRRGSI